MCALAHDPVKCTPMYVLYKHDKNKVKLHFSFNGISVFRFCSSEDEIRITHKIMNWVVNAIVTEIEEYNTLTNATVLLRAKNLRNEHPMGIFTVWSVEATTHRQCLNLQPQKLALMPNEKMN
jgi:hypothetical protein